MKLSAPPPPPPPPPELPAPGEQPPDPNNTEANATPETPAPEVPPAPPGPKPLKWPSWYSGIDAALVGLVLVFAFAAASFVARNSDVWLHLASGKRLLAGQYTPGTDPFSYAAPDRPWVNHSWLLDALAYLLYGGKGIVLGVAKALCVALAFGLLIAIRRPQFPLWPWAAVACVAVLASAPQFQLRPLVVSILFLSVLMFLLFRLPHKPNSWHFPIAIGVLFWVWANCDRWFFVGPLALALLVLGDFIQTKLLNTPDEPPTDGAEEPLGRLPDTVTLAKALGIGVLACMLNPHHVRVWDVPVELIKPAVMEADPRLRPLNFAPIDPLYMDNASLGYNLNGLAYAWLFIAGAIALGFGRGRVRVAHIALWIGFAALSLRSIYAIPFLAVVAVPLIAAQFNALATSERGRLYALCIVAAQFILLIPLVAIVLLRFARNAIDNSDRLVAAMSSVGRLVSVLLVCALCVIAYPGWAHPDASNAAYARRVAWGVEPDPALVRAAEQFKAWRESGKLPSDARGFVTNIDLANYLAWYAPQEKVFVNGRYNHHTDDYTQYVQVRKGLGLIEVKDEQPKLAGATDVLRKVNADYVAVHATPSDSIGLWNRANEAVGRLYRDSGEWAPWYADGRTTVFGWRPAGEQGGPAFAALRIDPVLLAFGPNVPRVPEPDPEKLHPLRGLEWGEAFVRAPKPAPIGASEALGWLRFKEGPMNRQFRRELIREALVRPFVYRSQGLPDHFKSMTTAGTMHGFVFEVFGGIGALPFPPDASTDTGPTGAEADAQARRAVALLALRAARRAIAEDPDHPDGYYALSRVMTDSDLPLSESERALGRATALRQCLTRMPPPERYKRGQFMASATEVSLMLVDAYLGQPIPGPRDPKTGQQTVRGYMGMPLDIEPIGSVLGQMVLDNPKSPQAPIERRPFALVQREGYPSNLRPLSGTTPYFLPLDAARETLVLGLQYVPIDFAGDSSEEAKKRTDSLDGARKEVETALIRVNERYGSAKAAGLDLPRLVEVAAHILPGEAHRLLTDPNTDLVKEYKDQAPHAAVLRISLELALGRIEDATDSLAELAKPESAATLDRFRLGSVVQLLRYQKALQAGEYKTAGELWGAIAGRVVGEGNKLPAFSAVPRDVIVGTVAAMRRSQTQQEAEKALALQLVPPIPLRPLIPFAPTLTAEFWRSDWNQVAQIIRTRIVEQMQAEANYFTRRGTLALLEGDIPAAKLWFQQARREPPAGWGLIPEFPQVASLYLRLIELADVKARTP